MKSSSNGNEDIVKAAITASKQAASLKDAAIAKLLEQRNQIDADLVALGYQMQREVIHSKPGSISTPINRERLEFPPYAGGLDFASISEELKRRANIVVRQTNCDYDGAVDRVLTSDKALMSAYGSCA